MISKRTRRALLCCALVAAVVASACDVPTPAEKAKAAEEIAKRSMLAIDHAALEQKLDPKVVEKLQQQLAALAEYMGPVNGKLDQVTVNAYEAFQRANEMTPDGIVTEQGLRELDEAVAARSAQAPQG
jgi:peptidoglycan hydrolase-like protein with peptidoglycan-binding domain